MTEQEQGHLQSNNVDSSMLFSHMYRVLQGPEPLYNFCRALNCLLQYILSTMEWTPGRVVFTKSCGPFTGITNILWEPRIHGKNTVAIPLNIKYSYPDWTVVIQGKVHPHYGDCGSCYSHQTR